MKLCLIDPNTKELLQIMNPPNPQDFEEVKESWTFAQRIYI